MKAFSRQSFSRANFGRTFKSHGPLIIFVAVFAVVGAIVLSHSFASSSTVTLLANAGLPSQIDSDDGQAVEVGVKFKSDVAGTVSGVRFYKSASNTGTHIGNVWSSTGTRLATVTFSGESGSGWQEATFSKPVDIAANTTYVVSYHTNTGHYSDSLNSLTSQLSNAPLHALADGASGPDGVYAYSGASSFPTSGYKATNYWVDVVFNPATATPTPPITPPITPPAALSVDQQVVAHPAGKSTTITAPLLATSSANELLLAFITSDGPSTSKGATVSSVSGGGLAWSLRQRSNAQGGTTEIWQAVAPKPIASLETKATLSGSFAGSMVVTAFQGADTSTNGAVAAASATSGAPKVALTTTRNGAWVWAAGNDYDKAAARTTGTGQVLVDQVLASVGDTYWVQRQAAATPTSGTSVTLNDTAPTSDRWNMAAIEILPATATPTPPVTTPPGPPTPPTNDTTPPSVPSSVTATATSSTQINLSWKASTDDVGVAGYYIFRNGVKVASVTATTYSDTSLAPNTAYSYYVEAYDAAGNVSSASSTTTTSTLTSPDQTAPSAPKGLTATATGPTQVNLSWTMSTDNIGVAGYLILRNNAVIATTANTTYSDTTAVANTSYTYAIEAKDAAGNISPLSTAVTVKTPNPADTTAPNVPTGVLATAVNQNQVNVTWAPSSDNVAVAGYTIYRNGTKLASSTVNSFGDGTVTADTSYSYTVSAYDGAGNMSAQSAAATVKTPASTIPNPPTSGGSAINDRPNDGSGYWPDFSNTGYEHTPANADGTGVPAYPGKLTDWQSGMSANTYMGITFPDNSVISYKHFVGKVGIFGKNLTFVGCLFEGTNPADNLVQVYTPDKIKFLYTTFKPISYAMPPGNNGTVSSSHTSPGTPFNQSWQMATTMQESVATMDHNNIWGNAGMEIVTGFPGQPSTWTNNYIHDASDTANNVYHHDGIGPQSEGNGGPMVVDHNTIATLGNTNGLALQGSGVYDHISVTNNYISGWGYALAFGTQNNATNITVTGNVFSAELSQLYGFLYGNIWGGTSHGSTWRDNLIQARSGDDNKTYSTTDNGKYAWPTDNDSHAADYTN